MIIVGETNETVSLNTEYFWSNLYLDRANVGDKTRLAFITFAGVQTFDGVFQILSKVFTDVYKSVDQQRIVTELSLYPRLVQENLSIAFRRGIYGIMRAAENRGKTPADYLVWCATTNPGNR